VKVGYEDYVTVWYIYIYMY